MQEVWKKSLKKLNEKSCLIDKNSVPFVTNLLTNNAIFGTVAGAFTRECGFSTIVWLLLSKQSEKSGIPQSALYLAETVHLKVSRHR